MYVLVLDTDALAATVKLLIVMPLVPPSSFLFSVSLLAPRS